MLIFPPVFFIFCLILMDHFYYRRDELYCEDVRVEEVAQKVGTPLYLYSQSAIIDNFREIREAFSPLDHLICYALKANSNLEILKILASQGCGADVVSGGELFLALRAGFDPNRIVYAGVGKRDDEIDYGIKAGILAFNVESEEELKVISSRAQSLNRIARIGIRVNPNISSQSHPYLSTGLAEDKFGIEVERATEVLQMALSLPSLEVIGLHSHIGSQILQVRPFIENVKSLVGLMKSVGIRFKYIDIGGGLGVSYGEEKALTPKDMVVHLYPLLKEVGCKVIFEPGRSLMANAGILVTQVLFVKRSRGKKFIIVDAGMNDLLRPSLYRAYHQIVPLKRSCGGPEVVEVVGPICESGDFLAKDRPLPPVKRGDLLAVLSVGAYGYSLSSNYNSRLRAPEVLVRGGDFRIIRRRERYEDLI